MNANVFPSLLLSFLQPRCMLCGLPQSGFRSSLCISCSTALHSPSTHCSMCGLPTSSINSLCGLCQHEPKPYQRMYCFGWYQGALKQLIQNFKYRGQYALGQALARAWLAHCSPDIPDLVIPVPTHSRKLASRGFNQASVLAYYLSQAHNLPVDQTTCHKVTPMTTQVHHSRKQRLTQANKAYRCDADLHGHIALVDDVVTSQATVMTLASLLKECGACRVDVWAIARTP